MPPCENCIQLQERLERQRERMEMLAGDKANLQLMSEILSCVTQLNGIENIACRTLDILMNSLGGINHQFYYLADNVWIHLDAFGKREENDLLEDPDILRAVESREFWGGPCDPIKETLQLTFDISNGKFEKWIFPLIVDDEVLGVIKTEGLLVHPNDSIVERLHIIASYIALVIKNENLNLSRLKQVNDALTQKNIELHVEMCQRIAAEREKDELHRQLQHAQKMEAVGTLAGGIAHNFNNLLGVILGYTDLALDDCDDAGIEHKLTQVVIASEKAKELIKQILTFSRKEDTEKCPVSLSEAVQDAMKLIRATLPSTIRIRLDTEPGLPTILGNHNLLHQIVMNLCTNAQHAMEEAGGALTVRLSSFSDADHNRQIKMEIIDTGMGISSEVLPRIFEPYFTTKEVGKGTGMGLAVVHGIVESFGGKIAVDSTVGRGTTVTCTFPAARAPISRKPVKQNAAQKFTGRALVVDGDEIVAELAKQMLTKLGFDVEIFVSSTDALEAFKQSPERYALVLIDYTMPGLTGLQLANQLLVIRKIPIVVSSGYSDVIDAHHFEAHGVSGFIGKPYKYRELEQLLSEIFQ